MKFLCSVQQMKYQVGERVGQRMHLEEYGVSEKFCHRGFYSPDTFLWTVERVGCSFL